MSNLRRAIPTLALLALGGLAAAQDIVTSTGERVHIVNRAEFERLAKERSDDIKEAAAAEKRGDLAVAEDLYRRACTAMGHEETFEHIFLARFFDRTGDARKAYAEYRIVVVGNPNQPSSLQSDPNILAHFGDLCLRYGTADDAREAYRLAVANGSRGYSDLTLLATARNDDFDVVRSAAHTASAIEYRWHLQPKECLAELELAVQLDDRNWTARIYRAYAYKVSGRKADAIREAMIAERMTSGKDREAVQSMRLIYRIPDENGKLPPEPPMGKPNPVYNVTKPVGSP